MRTLGPLASCGDVGSEERVSMFMELVDGVFLHKIMTHMYVAANKLTVSRCTVFAWVSKKRGFMCLDLVHDGWLNPVFPVCVRVCVCLCKCFYVTTSWHRRFQIVNVTARCAAQDCRKKWCISESVSFVIYNRFRVELQTQELHVFTHSTRRYRGATEKDV